MSVTRREFLTHTVLATGAIVGTSASVRWVYTSQPAVLTYFNGQLWLDPGGLSTQYVGPSGARGAEPLAALTDDELHTLYGRI